MRCGVLVLVGITCLFSALAFAHHSQVAVYDLGRTVTLEGDLAQILIRNPHSLVQVMAKDDKDEMQRWAVEWAAGAQLGRAGVDVKTLKAGDHVIITGRPGRDVPDHRLLMVTITRPADGFTST